MVQFLPAAPRKPSFGSQLGLSLGGGLGQGVSQGVQQHFQNEIRKKAEEAQFQKELQKLAIQNQYAKELQQEKLSFKQKEKQDFLNALGLGGESTDKTDRFKTSEFSDSSQQPKMQPDSLSNSLSDNQIAAISLMYPELGKVLQDQSKTQKKEFFQERSYHSDYTKKEEEKVNQLRESIPRKEMALNFARDAVESGNLGYFSLDKLADATGIDLFRTAKGAQLVTASKENLLSNMSRVSARAQNQWFEQRLNSMFPKIGQSKEANLTVQEMLDGEVALDQAYVNEFDRLSEEDEKRYGYVKKDITKRARDAVKPYEKEILARTSYKIKEIEEVEKGLTALKKEVGKNVPSGTPLTLAMAKLYKDKYGDNALAVAKKNGYHIPTLEEFQNYRLSPSQTKGME